MSFTNLNLCYSFNLIATTALKKLSSFECSEILITNKTGQDIIIYDANTTDASRSFLLGSLEGVVFRGITNSDQLSVLTTAGSGTIYCRTAYYSNLNQR
jgi:hypothetical protein